MSAPSPETAAALLARYERATAELEAPFALLDLDAMWSNSSEMVERAGGAPIRVASKSLRCRELLRTILDRGSAEARAPADGGFRGLMTFTLGETLWLHEQGFDDLLLAYPTGDRAALRALAALEGPERPIVMVDSVAHLDLVDSVAPPDRAAVRVCIELDVGWWPLGGRVRVGPKRSPIRTPAQAAALAREVVARDGFALAGLMGYEGHVAGFGDRQRGRALVPAVRRMQSASMAEMAKRRAAAVDAIEQVTGAPLALVNGGGTGSLHLTSREAAITELTAGSGFYAPTLFDLYSDFTLRPAAMFALPVVRRPGPGVATLLGGGYHASGPAGAERLPSPHLPAGLSLDGNEGAGEVQTPVVGAPADELRLGDRVYLRHAKAGELCERFDRLYVVEGERIVDELATYRGEGKTFL